MSLKEEKEKQEQNKKIAILLMAYGSPQNLDEVEPYLTHIRHGRKPSIEELEDLRRRYIAIGGISPLLKITLSTASRLEDRLRSRGYAGISVFAGMKHSRPFISEVVKQIASKGISKVVAITLAPHFSRMSVGEYQDAVRRANEQLENKMELHFIDQWYGNPIFVEKWANKIIEARNKYFSGKSVFHIFTAHSLPERIIQLDDPYRDQLYESSRSIASFLNLKENEYDFAFQSAGHTSEPWLGPDILDKINSLGKEKNSPENLLVVPIGFVSDHLEILYDIDIEAREFANKLGLRLERTNLFNDSDDMIEILESVLKEKSSILREQS